MGTCLQRHSVLIERSHERATLERAVDDARRGTGAVVVIEAPAGKGKTALLTLAGERARAAGLEVLSARGTELERVFPFGIALQLLEPTWATADAAARARLASGPGRWAADLLESGPRALGPVSDDHAYGMIHSLFWMIGNLTRGHDGRSEQAATAILVDDLHWADPSSLRLAAYLAARITGLSALLVATVRSGAPVDEPAAVASLRSGERATILQLAPLSDVGVAELTRSMFPNSDEAFCRACARVTAGNPFLLTELLDQVIRDDLPADAATAARLLTLTPDAVVHAVVARLGALPEAARRLATAVAISGERVPLSQAAALAGLGPEEAARGADVLVSEHILDTEALLAFRHPLIGSAVRGSVSPHDRALAHRRAGTVLLAEGGRTEAVAAQFLEGVPAGDPQVVGVLREAAQNAAGNGAVETAIRMLRRALAEPPPDADRVEVLAELGLAEAHARAPEATGRLEEAIAATRDRALRARLTLSWADLLQIEGRHREAVAVLDAALEQLGEPDSPVAADLDAARIGAACSLSERAPELADERRRLLARSGGSPSRVQRQALAQVARRSALVCESRSTVVELVRRAWGADASAAELVAPTQMMLMDSLMIVDELELELELAEAVLQSARALGSPESFAAGSYGRAWAYQQRGDVARSIGDARAALDAYPEHDAALVRGARAAVTGYHLHREELEEAERLLSVTPPPSSRLEAPLHLHLRSQLRLAQHRPEEAAADALEAGRLMEGAFDATSPGAIPWRTSVALAGIALGDREGAAQLAQAELELARRGGIGRAVVRALRVWGLSRRGEEGIALLEQAAAHEREIPRLETVAASIDLGAALRRANRRADARAPLRDALERCRRGGLVALGRRAQVELQATGARPRNVMRTGIAALTPSERRVGSHAAQGLTTRQIAETLFVTPKTVEFHLRNVYMKLDVRSRSQLAQRLQADEAVSA